MHLDRYPFQKSADYFEYEFISKGPKGAIKKIVRFDEFTVSDGQTIFNLAFGDWNDATGTIDDEIVSNNEDTKKVLATVAFIALDFTSRFPGAILYAEGSTLGRTRKYQMTINRLYEDISELFLIFGVAKDGTVYPFEKNVNYQGFLVRSKA